MFLSALCCPCLVQNARGGEAGPDTQAKWLQLVICLLLGLIVSQVVKRTYKAGGKEKGGRSRPQFENKDSLRNASSAHRAAVLGYGFSPLLTMFCAAVFKCGSTSSTRSGRRNGTS